MIAELTTCFTSCFILNFVFTSRTGTGVLLVNQLFSTFNGFARLNRILGRLLAGRFSLISRMGPTNKGCKPNNLISQTLKSVPGKLASKLKRRTNSTRHRKISAKSNHSTPSPASVASCSSRFQFGQDKQSSRLPFPHLS